MSNSDSPVSVGYAITGGLGIPIAFMFFGWLFINPPPTPDGKPTAIGIGIFIAGVVFLFVSTYFAWKYLAYHSRQKSLITSLTPLPITYDLFFSYATIDSEVAIELRNSIEAAGVKCFMAETDITPTQDWQEKILHAMRESRHVFFMMTPRSIGRPWVQMESGAAMILEKKILSGRMYVEPEQLLGPMQKYQSVKLESLKQRADFIEQMAVAKK